MSCCPKKAGFGGPFPSLLTEKSSKGRVSELAGFFSGLLFLGALPLVADIQVISCLLQNVTTAPTENESIWLLQEGGFGAQLFNALCLCLHSAG